MIFTGVVSAQSPDKSQYTLFNPTPPELMRPMSTDRPDTTESAYTVDAGHFQFEGSFISYTHDNDGADVDAYSIMPMNLKIGLLNNVDLQLVINPFDKVRTHDAGNVEQLDGFGDMQLRLKINLWGNDSGDTALAIMPFIKFPTAQDDLGNDHVEGGIIIPLAISLPHDFGLGLMAEIDVVRDAEDDHYGVEFVHTATISHEIVGPLSGFIEYAGIAPIDTGSTYLAYFDMGLTYEVSPNMVLDCGVNIGLSEAAEDFTFFAGMSFRH